MTVRPSSNVHENLSGGRVQTAGSIDVMLKVITINDTVAVCRVPMASAALHPELMYL